MARQNRNAEEESETQLSSHVEKVAGEVSLSVSPVVICGVNRKVNIGNYESLDIYAGVTIPLKDVDVSDVGALKTAVTEACSTGFAIASKETFDRYTLIKGEK